MQGWISPRLGIRFVPGATGLQIYQPDGARFLTFVELDEHRQQEQVRAIFAEERAAQAEEERTQAEKRAAHYAAKLRAMGIDPDADEGA